MANNQIALLAQAPVFETPFESQGKALQIRQMMNQGEVQDMDMQAKRQAMEEDSISRAAFSANPTDSKARLAALARAPKAYQAERKALQDAEKVSADIGQTKANTKKAEIEGAIKTMDAAGQALGFVMANPTMENAMSTLDYLGRNGIYSPEDLAHYKEVITKDPTQIKALAEQAFRGALAAKDQLAKIDTRNLGNRMETRSIDPITGKDTMLGSQTIGQSPDSVASIAQQERNSRRVDARAREGRADALSKPFEVTGPDGLPVLVQQTKAGIVPVEGYAPKRAAQKPLPPAVVKTLTEARDNATTMDRLNAEFKPEFGGKGLFGLGADMSMSVKGNTGLDQKSVAFWKDYKKNAELVERHAMFGASLTPGEQASWRSADVAPGMDPDVIKTNLATRAALTKKVAAATADDMVDAGHNEARVRAIAGRGEKAPSSVSAPAQVTNAADYAKVPSGAEYMAPDGQLRRKP